ncbi:MAG: metallophosphoesterase family protein [Chitinispirillaceae bacterium]|nr:metallophosphoesterase family protein [Chitinispirillaceae bacterium]
MPLSKIKKTEQIQIRNDGSLRLAVVSDTHSTPHPRAYELISGLHPDAIIHAGDVGEFSVIDNLSAIAPVFAVRGNIDLASLSLPDTLLLEICSETGLVLRILILHVGIYGHKLRSEVFKMARAQEASLVVCGHSHIPFIGNDRGIAVFNPGSIGPRRFGLPIVFGILQLDSSGARLSHIDCETGEPWHPPCR